jgi:hypothetical protein
MKVPILLQFSISKKWFEHRLSIFLDELATSCVKDHLQKIYIHTKLIFMIHH